MHYPSHVGSKQKLKNYQFQFNSSGMNLILVLLYVTSFCMFQEFFYFFFLHLVNGFDLVMYFYRIHLEMLAFGYNVCV